MKFAYEDLSEAQFEGLVVLICHRLFGISTQGFSKGVDGGRDAKFVGTAELHPSKAAPWVGVTIIQAKHTNGYNRHFAETDFYSPTGTTTVLAKEALRIKKLRDDGHLDQYMLFANRRLAGNAETEIRAYIANSCGIPEASVYLCGVEQLELWLKTFADIPKIAALDPIDSPLIVSPDALAEVVQRFAHQKGTISTILDVAPTPRVSYETKNKLNNMSGEYAKELRKRYLKDTAAIAHFLAAPDNLELLKLYETTVDEFQLKIVAHRKDYQSFDLVMEYLLDLLFNRDPILRQRDHKRLTRAMLFYMYWHCDIGVVDDVATH